MVLRGSLLRIDTNAVLLTFNGIPRKEIFNETGPVVLMKNNANLTFIMLEKNYYARVVMIIPKVY